MTTTDPLTARKVGAAVRRAGFPTGYRYTQTGYRTHDGRDIDSIGCDVTRTAGNARRGLYDAGEVRVYVIRPHGFDQKRQEMAVGMIARALAAEFPGRTITKGTDTVTVSDTVESDIVTQHGVDYDVTFTVTMTGAPSPEMAAAGFRNGYLIATGHDQPVTVTRADGRGETVTVPGVETIA